MSARPPIRPEPLRPLQRSLLTKTLLSPRSSQVVQVLLKSLKLRPCVRQKFPNFLFREFRKSLFFKIWKFLETTGFFEIAKILRKSLENSSEVISCFGFLKNLFLSQKKPVFWSKSLENVRKLNVRFKVWNAGP